MTLPLALRAGLLGVATGSRSSAGLAGLALTSRSVPESPQPLAAASAKRAKQLTGLLVLAELIGDKLPQTPSRLQLPGFGLRVLFGGVSGLLLAQREAAPVAVPAAAGAAGALGGTFVTAKGREAIIDSDIPDHPGAIAEDALALGLAYYAARPVAAPLS